MVRILPDFRKNSLIFVKELVEEIETGAILIRQAILGKENTAPYEKESIYLKRVIKMMDALNYSQLFLFSKCYPWMVHKVKRDEVLNHFTIVFLRFMQSHLRCYTLCIYIYICV